MDFLSEIIEKLITNNEIAYKDTLIVLPNRRARRMLLSRFAQRISEPTFAPQILTINDFINFLSPYQLAEKHLLMIQLFDSYCSISNKTDYDFQDFIGWGILFLDDINEIDLQRVNADEILSNIADIKELETSFGIETLSKNQAKYLDFYRHLATLYHEFRKNLQQQNLAYEGMIYRDVAENISEYSKICEYKRIIFAGFHALSQAEMAIIDFFYKNRTTEILFDIDHLYAEKYTPFVKKIQTTLGLPEIQYKNDFRDIPKKIYVTGISKKISQVYHAIDCLNDIEQQQGNLENTVLVFADESLLVPFIHAYGCQKANFTMGYPFKATAAAQLLDIIFTMIRTAQRFQKMQSAENLIFYYKDVFAFTQNSLIAQYAYNNQVQQTLQKWIDDNTLFFSNTSSFSPEKIQLPSFDSTDSLLKDINTLLTNLLSFIPKNTFDYLTVETVSKTLFNIDNKIDTLIESLKGVNPNQIKTIETFAFFVNESLSSLSIPFQGDFDKGLQVMGLLESRTLDFDNVIVLSVNEGKLPKGKVDPSMIMYDVKKHFHLPTFHEKDSIFAYHFFRLLQRAKLIHLIYDNDSSDNLAEKSRFIQQIKFEISARNLENSISLEERNYSILPKNLGSLANSITIKKDESMREKLLSFRYSATSLILYKSCPLKFYFQNIAGIEPPNSIIDNMESSIIGIITHKVLQNTLGIANATSTDIINSIDQTLKNLDKEVISTFAQQKETQDLDTSKGAIFLAKEVVKNYVQSYLKQVHTEMQANPYSILECESNLKLIIDINSSTKLEIKGTIDRIDNRDGIIHILDYKTGYVDEKKLKLDNIEMLFKDSEYDKLFQLMIYALLYDENCPGESNHPLQCGIVSLQNISREAPIFIHYVQILQSENTENGGRKKKKESSSIVDKETLQIFKEELKKLLAEIIDLDHSFEQTTDTINCSSCSYAQICGLR